MTRKVFIPYSHFALSVGVLGFNRVFSHRNYLILFSGTVISLFTLLGYFHSFLVSMTEICTWPVFVYIFRTFLEVGINDK